ncbi:hypothetical protein V8E53_003048 [Lactarius tabidus]
MRAPDVVSVPMALLNHAALLEFLFLSTCIYHDEWIRFAGIYMNFSRNITDFLGTEASIHDCKGFSTTSCLVSEYENRGDIIFVGNCINQIITIFLFYRLLVRSRYLLFVFSNTACDLRPEGRQYSTEYNVYLERAAGEYVPNTCHGGASPHRGAHNPHAFQSPISCCFLQRRPDAMLSYSSP